MPTNRGILEEQGFNRFNRREDYSEPVIQDIPLSATNQVIPDSALDANKVIINALSLIQETELQAAASTAIASNFINKKFIRITFFVAGFSDTDYPKVTFNSDTGNNYSWDLTVTENGTPQYTDAQNTSAINVGSTNSQSSTYPQYIVLDIENLPNRWKIVSVTGASAGGGTSSATLNGSGMWKNTAVPITTVTFAGLNGKNFLAGSNLRVFGL